MLVKVYLIRVLLENDTFELIKSYKKKKERERERERERRK